jgi:nicotinamidase-related amidase
MKPLPPTAVLLVVDMQKAFYDPSWGPRNNPALERNVRRLQDAWRRTGRPIVHVRHMSTSPTSTLRPGQPGNAIMDEVAPLAGEPVVEKTVNSAFIGTTLEADLRRRGVDTIVVTGIQTNHCVSTTARMAGNLGFDTYVVADGTATFDRAGHDGVVRPAELLHAVALADLHGEFATIVETDALLEALDAAEVGGVRAGDDRLHSAPSSSPPPPGGVAAGSPPSPAAAADR